MTEPVVSTSTATVARWWATVGLDVRLQARNQLYTMGFGVGLVSALLLVYLVGSETIRPFLPAALTLHLGGTTCFFGSALVLFEKSQGTLAAQWVSPLRLGEYQASKVATLGTFAMLEGLVMLGVTQGLDFRPLPYLLGALSLGAIYTLAGLVLVAPHSSITEFMVPNGIVLGTLVGIPVLPTLGVPGGAWWLLVPLTPQITLFEAALGPIDTWRWIYALVGTVVELGVLWFWARRRFERHVIGATFDGGRS